MNSRKNFTSQTAMRNAPLRRTLAVALALGLGFTGTAFGQATTGSIFGQVPAATGETVLVQNSAGFSREVPVNSTGRYAVSSLPLGSYTVTLLRDGETVDTRTNVSLSVGSGTEVSFASAADDAQNLAAVTVQANALPSIDVSAVDSRTVITAEQLKRLPIGRSAESIALLAPGVNAGSSYFSGNQGGQALVTFGGSSVTENAYYINGFNTTDPLGGLGGLTLPYGAIEQEQLLTGGYSAAYGRSDGGVLSMVGKRGTNEWHFGGQVQWTPTFAKGDQRDIHWVNGPDKGEIYNRQRDDKTWTTTYDAYVGGPLIRDKLFFFAAAEFERQQGSSIGSTESSYKNQYRYDMPKWYTKVDWNINENNVLELTGASNKTSYQSALYDYDYDTDTEGGFHGNNASTKTGADMWSAKFTSYITDDITLSAMYGEMDGTYYNNLPGYDPSVPYTLSTTLQNPALNGGRPIRSSQTELYLDDARHTSKNTNLRVDLTWRIGDHDLAFGIDNQRVTDTNDGQVTSGPNGAPGTGYAWLYYHENAGDYIVGDPTAPLFVDAPGNYRNGQEGYFVSKYIYRTAASAETSQYAQYIEDTWQINDRWMVKLGLRNDQFTNYNPEGDAYLRLTKPQWAPRLGFSWDVNGDSSFKVYGNAGRYYLALPSSVALRGAGNSLFTEEYFTYGGIDSNGIPYDLTPIETSTGGPLSKNGEYGEARDPRTATATNLKSEYQDEFILGFEKQLTPGWTYGVKAQYRSLKTAIDDVGDAGAIAAKMEAMGIDLDTVGTINGGYIFNPGRTNIFQIAKADGSGYYAVPMTNDDFGFTNKLKRDYYSLQAFLTHPFDGKWMGQVSYTYARSYGNSEGQVRSDLGQTDVAATEDWDYWQLMSAASGELPNARQHEIKAYGYYQLTDEWMLSGNAVIQSGTPKSCLGFFGPNETNPGGGYGPDYHWCSGQPSPPGKVGHEAWQYTFSVGAEYRPVWAEKRLGFSVDVNNIFNNRIVTQSEPHSGSAATIDPSYRRAVSQTTPRYVRFGISYDF